MTPTRESSFRFDKHRPGYTRGDQSSIFNLPFRYLGKIKSLPAPANGFSTLKLPSISME